MRHFGDAALTYTHPVTGQEIVHPLGAPLRDLRPRHNQWRSVRTSLDRSVTQVVTIGGGAYEFVGRIRYDALPDSLLDLLIHGANGVPVTYWPSIASTVSYTGQIIPDGEAVGLAPDPDRYMHGEYEATIVLRRAEPFTGLLGRSGLIFNWQAGLLLPPGAFSRTSPAWTWDKDGILRETPAGKVRTSWLDLDGDGRRETPALRLEPGATNLLRASSDFGSSTWGTGVGLVQSPASSIIQGQTATKHENDGTGGSRNRAQAVGMFSGGKETAYIIVENVDAIATQVSLRDTTQSAFVHRASLNWNTGEATRLDGYDANATHGAIKLADAGPNGGPVYLLWITTTGVEGNGRSIYIYPTGTTNAQTAAILHHAQLVQSAVVTLPIVTGAGSASMAADSLYLDLPQSIATPGAVDLAIYARHIVGASGIDLGTTPGVWGIIDGSGSPPRLQLYLSSTNGRLTLSHNNGVSPSSEVAQTPVAPVGGDLVETVSIFRRDGSGRLIASVNGGPLAGADLAALAPAAAWSAPRLYVGSRGSAAGVFDYLALKVHAGGLTGSDVEMMTYMRRAA